MQRASTPLTEEWERRLGNLSKAAIRGKEYRQKLLVVKLRAVYAARGNRGDGNSHSSSKRSHQ